MIWVEVVTETRCIVGFSLVTLTNSPPGRASSTEKPWSEHQREEFSLKIRNNLLYNVFGYTTFSFFLFPLSSPFQFKYEWTLWLGLRCAVLLCSTYCNSTESLMALQQETEKLLQEGTLSGTILQRTDAGMSSFFCVLKETWIPCYISTINEAHSWNSWLILTKCIPDSGVCLNSMPCLWCTSVYTFSKNITKYRILTL